MTHPSWEPRVLQENKWVSVRFRTPDSQTGKPCYGQHSCQIILKESWIIQTPSRKVQLSVTKTKKNSLPTRHNSESHFSDFSGNQILAHIQVTKLWFACWTRKFFWGHCKCLMYGPEASWHIFLRFLKFIILYECFIVGTQAVVDTNRLQNFWLDCF